MAYMDGITCICDNGRTLEDHRPIVGDDVISGIYRKAASLRGKRVLHVNSTYQSGGVAEMILSLVPLMNNVGIDTRWNILNGDGEFFAITKNFHNALQGQAVAFSDEEKDLYLQTNEAFSGQMAIDHDLVVIHDPQPLPLIRFYRKTQPWVWRCHVDLSNPNPALWEFLKGFVLDYDRMVISHEHYRRRGMPMEQWICRPAIDPLSEKNRDLSEAETAALLAKYGVPTDKPLVTQISRFDKWKDPLGVVEVFSEVKRHVDCRLVLCGSMAPDDPEGWAIYRQVEDAARPLIDAGDVILITAEDHLLVNALQRASAVILQKSLREGFGLTVTEGLWKGRPVIASRVGGIPLQIEDGVTGFLLDPTDTEGFAWRVRQVLENPDLGERLGRAGKEHVRQHFLITRLLSDYLDMLNAELTIQEA
ncbi:glycosyltransferase [Methanoculleus bourgensis]|jgi:trehalose synthase|uniref:Trehalose synthase n=2 Tax=Methanoculleus bourgensis TaxID=83986 RepID=I7KBQ1_METBM|nr:MULTISPECIES: glycosyltransferase [Methanoculleus]MBT0733233.1 glycosyltransferase [Methanoculleus bourgensis]MDD3372471.1 glycosyltransferase [Methanoculleus bourgensis]CCJ35551.1 trehalose synthase [Methanoculleus bourgensis MS2]CVK32028.1 Trehalose synthase [Methanoculleus bourgensis]